MAALVSRPQGEGNKKAKVFKLDSLSSQTKCNTLLRCCGHGKKIQTVLAGSANEVMRRADALRWIPAFAGMTRREKDEGEIKQESPISVRKRTSVLFFHPAFFAFCSEEGTVFYLL